MAFLQRIQNPNFAGNGDEIDVLNVNSTKKQINAYQKVDSSYTVIIAILNDVSVN
jgi:hypothetical protein